MYATISAQRGNWYKPNRCQFIYPNMGVDTTHILGKVILVVLVRNGATMEIHFGHFCSDGNPKL